MLTIQRGKASEQGSSRQRLKMEENRCRQHLWSLVLQEPHFLLPQPACLTNVTCCFRRLLSQRLGCRVLIPGFASC